MANRPSLLPVDTAGDPLHRRLLWLTVGRVGVITLLFGGTLFLAVDERHGYGSFTPRALIALIVGSYIASLVFLLWIRAQRGLPWLARTEVAHDLVLVTTLVYVTGASGSVFSPLFAVVVLLAAIVLGSRAAPVTAGCALVLFTAVGIGVASGWLPHPPDQDARIYALTVGELGFALLSNVTGLVVVALLASNLSQRLRRAGGELLRAEANVASLTQLHDDIVRSIASGLMTVDPSGVVRTANPAACEMFRADAPALIGQPIGALLPVTADTEMSRGEGTATRPDETAFPVGFTMTALRDAHGDATGGLVVFQDLTEIRALRDQAARAEQLAILGRLATGLAHEIRNPLSSIGGSVELVRDAADLGEEDRHLLQIVLGEVDRLEELVSTMLAVGRPSEPRRAPVDLCQLARDVVAMAQRGVAAQLGVTVAIDTPEQPIIVAVDGGQIRQVLWNLLKNALQASSRGDQVSVRVRRTPDGDALLQVRDRGDGIDPDAQSKLFEMFYSGRAHGVGMGLALVKQIVDRHQGEIRLESARGEGALFEVHLPASAS